MFQNAITTTLRQLVVHSLMTTGLERKNAKLLICINAYALFLAVTSLVPMPKDLFTLKIERKILLSEGMI